MQITEDLVAVLRREGWHAVSVELARLAERRHPQSLLVAGYRLAATASRRGAADRQHRDRRGSVTSSPGIPAALRSAPGHVAGRARGAPIRLGSELTPSRGCE